MTDPNRLLWNHAIENEDWEEAARIAQQSTAQGETPVVHEDSERVQIGNEDTTAESHKQSE